MFGRTRSNQEVPPAPPSSCLADGAFWMGFALLQILVAAKVKGQEGWLGGSQGGEGSQDTSGTPASTRERAS